MVDEAALQAGRRYLDRLSDSDRRLLARAVGTSRLVPEAFPDLLGRDEVLAAVLPPHRTPPPETLSAASPFLVFAVAVARTVADLMRSSYVPEWSGPRRRVLVFASGELLEFVAHPWHELFLSELLASYAHVASGSVYRRTARGWRRQRWSELDPVRLAALLDVVPAPERAGIYRRLGDLALFLTGVFPDHTATHGPGADAARRLLAAAGAAGVDRGSDPLALLEFLGRRWYSLAARAAIARTADTTLLTEVAARFSHARRVLNVVTERYLLPAGNPWLPSR